MRIFDLRRLVPLMFLGLIITASPAMAQSNDDDKEERPAPADTRPQTPPQSERPSLRRRPAQAPPPAPPPPREPAPKREENRESGFRVQGQSVWGQRGF